MTQLQGWRTEHHHGRRGRRGRSGEAAESRLEGVAAPTGPVTDPVRS